MGWLFYDALKKNGRVDVKGELDRIHTWSENDHGIERSCKVLASSVIDNTYYAAVEFIKGSERKVTAVVCLVSTGNVNGFNFGYKGMDESMEPCAYDCPVKILDLLTPTDNEYALSWREKCRQRHKARALLTRLPIGSVISFTTDTGKVVRLYKHAPGYQFKTTFWMSEAGGFMSKKRIPDDFTVVSKGGC